MGRTSIRVYRVLWGVVLSVILLGSVYWFWSPGLLDRSGRHDLSRNAIWLGHGWLGDDAWFVRNHREAQYPRFRSRERVRALTAQMQAMHITDVYPHLCPANPDGSIAREDVAQTEMFLDETNGLRVMPWIGGVLDRSALIDDPGWRRGFVTSVQRLFSQHPRMAGVHVNVEPCPSGNPYFLRLLEELRAAMPAGKVLSVSAYPPPTAVQPSMDVHWDAAYFREVSRRVDQVAVMMYDTGLRLAKPYEALMARWTREVLDTAQAPAVLLGLAAYQDEGVGYHDPAVENLATGLRGVHRGLAGYPRLPARYQGVAIYSEWEMDAQEWAFFRSEFLRSR